MRSELRDGWYVRSIDEGTDLRRSGIYQWRIDGVGVYVGKAKILHSRIRDYPNNVRRMIDGLPWHGNPNRAYRKIHHELRKAYDEGVAVSVEILEFCELSLRAERESYWIAERRKEEMEGGPSVLNSA